MARGECANAVALFISMRDRRHVAAVARGGRQRVDWQADQAQQPGAAHPRDLRAQGGPVRQVRRSLPTCPLCTPIFITNTSIAVCGPTARASARRSCCRRSWTASWWPCPRHRPSRPSSTSTSTTRTTSRSIHEEPARGLRPTSRDDHSHALNRIQKPTHRPKVYALDWGCKPTKRERDSCAVV